MQTELISLAVTEAQPQINLMFLTHFCFCLVLCHAFFPTLNSSLSEELCAYMRGFSVHVSFSHFPDSTENKRSGYQ